MLKRTHIFVFLLLFALQLLSQDRATDSLKNLLKTNIHDTTRCDILAQLVELEPNEDVWQKYNLELKDKCEKFLRTHSEKDPLRRFYLEHLSAAFNNIGYGASQRGDIPLALQSFKKSMEYKDQTGDLRGMAVCLSNVGVIYDNQGDIPKALEYYNKSLKIVEQLGDKKGMATTLNNLATVYDSQHDTTMALKYYRRALKAYEDLNEQEGIGIVLNNISFLYAQDNYFNKAYEYYSRSLKIREMLQDKLGMATTLNNLGAIHKSFGDTAKALNAYTRSYSLSEEIDDKDGMANCLNNLAITKLQQRKWKEAIPLAEKGLKLAKELGYPGVIRDLSRSLSEIYAKNSNWKDAYDMQVLFKQMSDSLNSEKNKKASIQKAFQYEYEKKVEADSIRTIEERRVHAAQIKEERTQRFALYGGLILIVAFSIFIFNRFRVTQKQKHIIEEQKQKVSHAYELLNEKNKEVMDSIHYAKRIQNALITSEKYLSSQLNRLKKG